MIFPLSSNRIQAQFYKTSLIKTDAMFFTCDYAAHLFDYGYILFKNGHAEFYKRSETRVIILVHILLI